MKKLFPVLLVMFFGAAVLFTACTEEPAATEPLPTAWVKGTVEYNADLTNSPVIMSKVPNGTKIFFRIDAADLVLNPLPNYSYQTIQKEAIVNDGRYAIELECATHQAVVVTIVPDEFVQPRKMSASYTDTEYYYKPVTPGWGTPITVAIQNGETHNLDITYN